MVTPRTPRHSTLRSTHSTPRPPLGGVERGVECRELGLLLGIESECESDGFDIRTQQLQQESTRWT